MRSVAFAVLAATVAAQSDTQCGNLTLPLSSTKPNLLIIGDSISMPVPYTPGGYFVNVYEALSATWEVQHAGGAFGGGQCSNTVKGLLCTNTSYLDNYLNFTGTFDVVHMNYGLHDLVNCTDNPECAEHVDVDVYAQNLVTLYQRWAPRTKKFIYATTTPVPNVVTSLGRSYELAVMYNQAAVKALTAAGVTEFDDLWQGVINYCGAYYTSCDLQLPKNVHFEPKGQAFLGAMVVKSVQAAYEQILRGE